MVGKLTTGIRCDRGDRMSRQSREQPVLRVECVLHRDPPCQSRVRSVANSKFAVLQGEI